VAEFTLTSPSFEHGEPIPRHHTCDAEDLSPPLAWSNAPSRTRSFALIVDDPDAPGGTFTHWLGWGIEPQATGFMEGERAPIEGRNDFENVGYRGPCPPPGHGTHRYFFRLHALDAEVEVASGAARDELEPALGSVIAVAELVGTYER
jgi:Raf kinase inhibitor-like YbhB/YbcL family protein